MDNTYKNNILRPILACGLGTYLEFLDFALYASLAPIFALRFFPVESHEVSIIYSWGIFAISFIVRPFAGLFLGPIGDRLGIKKLMLFSLGIMGLATTAIGMLPTYEQAGILAPMMLIGLRIIQGFAVSIEYGGLSVYLSKISEIRKKFGFYSSFTSVAVISGMLSGGIITSILLDNKDIQSIPDWQWRAPFIICGLLVGLSGFYLRLNMRDMPQNSIGSTKGPLRTLFEEQAKNLFLATLITGFISISAYTIMGYFSNYLQSVKHYNVKGSLFLCNIFGLILLSAVPIGGWLSDKMGRIPLIRVFSFLMIFISIFSMALIVHGNFNFLLLGAVLLSWNIGIIVGVLPAFITEVFHNNHRYTGVTVAYNAASAWLGGVSPMILSFLLVKTGNAMIPGVYISFFAVVSFFSAKYLNGSSQKALVSDVCLNNIVKVR